MKKAFILGLGIIIISLSSFIMVKDPAATKVLDQASAKFKLLKSFKADYTMLVENTQNKMKETYSGTVEVSGTKFKIVTADTEIYCDGETVWSYMKEDNEVTVTEYDEEDGFMNVDKILTIYKSGYKYVMLPEQTVASVACYVIDFEPDLTPEERKTNQVYKIRMSLEKSTHVIKSWKIFERNGNRFTYTIKNFKANQAVTDALFKFDKSKHLGVEVEDLR